MKDMVSLAAQIKPSDKQLAWQRMEFYGFSHFGVNTFTNREWGIGDEDPAIFHPTAFDARQWVSVCKSAGMTGLILTCKHHDGFCLWPSRFTDHSVKHSPWKGGNGDVVREVADACREGGIKFGIYLSPWDRHEPSYGDSDAYNLYYRNQLTELLTGYGDVFCVWLDGACGEGPNGKRQQYDWKELYSLVNRLQPNAAICVCGPDVRWCGNEAGHCRQSEWSVVPAVLKDCELTADKSQKADDSEFSHRVDSQDEDLGGREVIAHADSLIWYPAEVDTSIRPGWFYHPEEDGRVRSCEELLHIYYNAVGGNAALLLNIPPDTRGLMHENDAAVLRQLGDTLRNTFAHDLAACAVITATGSIAGHTPDMLTDGSDETWWQPQQCENAVVEIAFVAEQEFDTIVLMEHIRNGQRVEVFTLEAQRNGSWETLAEGTVIGYKRICRFAPVTALKLRLTIKQSRTCPELSKLGIFKSVDCVQ